MSLSDIDPDVLLEWLQTPSIPPEDDADDSGASGGGMQQVALEQLCMVLLMSDNIDRLLNKFLAELHQTSLQLVVLTQMVINSREALAAIIGDIVFLFTSSSPSMILTYQTFSISVTSTALQLKFLCVT